MTSLDKSKLTIPAGWRLLTEREVEEGTQIGDHSLTEFRDPMYHENRGFDERLGHAGNIDGKSFYWAKHYYGEYYTRDVVIRQSVNRETTHQVEDS